jgi:hypothetical protein
LMLLYAIWIEFPLALPARDQLIGSILFDLHSIFPIDFFDTSLFEGIWLFWLLAIVLLGLPLLGLRLVSFIFIPFFLIISLGLIVLIIVVVSALGFVIIFSIVLLRLIIDVFIRARLLRS